MSQKNGNDDTKGTPPHDDKNQRKVISGTNGQVHDDDDKKKIEDQPPKTPLPSPYLQPPFDQIPPPSTDKKLPAKPFPPSSPNENGQVSTPAAASYARGPVSTQCNINIFQF